MLESSSSVTELHLHGILFRWLLKQHQTLTSQRSTVEETQNKFEDDGKLKYAYADQANPAQSSCKAGHEKDIGPMLLPITSTLTNCNL